MNLTRNLQARSSMILPLFWQPAIITYLKYTDPMSVGLLHIDPEEPQNMERMNPEPQGSTHQLQSQKKSKNFQMKNLSQIATKSRSTNT